MDAEGEAGVEDAGDGEKSDEEAHVGFYCTRRGVQIEMGRRLSLPSHDGADPIEDYCWMVKLMRTDMGTAVPLRVAGL
jgi:hypothetical protein